MILQATKTPSGSVFVTLSSIATKPIFSSTWILVFSLRKGISLEQSLVLKQRKWVCGIQHTPSQQQSRKHPRSLYRGHQDIHFYQLVELHRTLPTVRDLLPETLQPHTHPPSLPAFLWKKQLWAIFSLLSDLCSVLLLKQTWVRIHEYNSQTSLMLHNFMFYTHPTTGALHSVINKQSTCEHDQVFLACSSHRKNSSSSIPAPKVDTTNRRICWDIVLPEIPTLRIKVNILHKEGMSKRSKENSILNANNGFQGFHSVASQLIL